MFTAVNVAWKFEAMVSLQFIFHICIIYVLNMFSFPKEYTASQL